MKGWHLLGLGPGLELRLAVGLWRASRTVRARVRARIGARARQVRSCEMNRGLHCNATRWDASQQ